MQPCGQSQASTTTSVQMAFSFYHQPWLVSEVPSSCFQKPLPLSWTSPQALPSLWECSLASDSSSKFHQLSLTIICYRAEELDPQWSEHATLVERGLEFNTPSTHGRGSQLPGIPNPGDLPPLFVSMVTHTEMWVHRQRIIQTMHYQVPCCCL